MSAMNLKLEQDPCAKAVLALLLGFRNCATLRAGSPQEAAVGWPLVQQAAGADAACLRSLLAAGLIEPVGGAEGAVAPGPQSRFVLTEAGCRLAWQAAAAPVGPRLATQTCRRPLAPGEKPRWDRVGRELWFAGEVVLRFRRGASNQERLLEAFEEQGWPPHIDDPLPHTKGKGRRKRLCDTLRHLSAAQRAIRFRVNADGRAVLWAPREGR
jgi:hypothetical protein